MVKWKSLEISIISKETSYPYQKSLYSLAGASAIPLFTADGKDEIRSYDI